MELRIPEELMVYYFILEEKLRNFSLTCKRFWNLFLDNTWFSVYEKYEKN